jgi:hypothetical protein
MISRRTITPLMCLTIARVPVDAPDRARGHRAMTFLPMIS